EAMRDDGDLVVERVVPALERRLAPVDLYLLELRKHRVANGEAKVGAENGPYDVACILGDGRVGALVAQPQLQRGLERRDAGLELHLRLEPVVDEIVIDAIDGDVGAVVPEHRLEDIERKGAVLPGAGVADAVHEEDSTGARPEHRLRLEW